MAISFTHLSLRMIAVDSMLEVLLGNTDKYLDGNAGMTARNFLEDSSQREGRHGVAAAAEERLYQSGADKMFAFSKLGVQCLRGFSRSIVL